MMNFGQLYLVLVLTDLCLSKAFPNEHHIPKPAAFFLAGDSTTAIINAAKTGGGWGDGFLATLRNEAIGFNYGHNGATTVSFKAGGDWDQVLAGVAGNKTTHTPFVTIQFGHNDQKPTANLTVEQYSANLYQFGLDVRSAGGQPIFVTSLSRRKFNNATGLVIEDLAVQAEATIAVAHELGAWVIDLNRASVILLNSVGAENATLYNLTPTDFTHLNAYGQEVFGNLVSWLLLGLKGSDFWRWTRPEETLAREFERLFFDHKQ